VSQPELHPSATRVMCGNCGAPHSNSRFLTPPRFLARASEDPCQVALVTFDVTAEVHAGRHAHIGVPKLVGYPGNGKVRLIEEGRDCAAERVRNRPGQAARVESSANRSRAVALVPPTVRITLSWRSEGVAFAP
jgi:hypothetical protein